MSENKKPLAVVLTRNYSTGLSVIRSLGVEGYTVDVIASAIREGKSASVASSKYVRNSVEVVSKKVNGGGDTAMMEALLSYRGQNEEKPILFPTDDYTTSVMDLNRDALEDIFVMPQIAGGKAGDLKHHMDKSVQGELARKVGILTPQEWVISLREEDIIIPDEMVYPCYCKPLESSLGYKQEMARCENKEELLKHLKKLRANFADRSILVQEFMNIDIEIDLEGVCIDQEIVLPAIIWKRIVAQYDKGVPLAGHTADIEKLGEMKEKIIAFLKEFHYVGMFDLGMNVIGDQLYFNELNMRSGGTNYVYFMSGVNLPVIFAKEVTGEKHLPEEAQIKELGKTYVYEKVAWDDYVNEYMTREELDDCIETADIRLMLNSDDPAPGEFFIKEAEELEERRQQRDPFVTAVSQETGWARSKALIQLKDAKDRVGISFKDYVKLEFWQYPEEEQEAEYKAVLEKREKKRKQREERIATVMEATGWEHDYAHQQMKAAREATGAPFKDYIAAELWKYDEAGQKEAYEKLLQKRERIKQQKEACIKAAMDTAGWTQEEAEEKIKEARNRMGISYNDYRRHNFCLIPVEDQQKHYDKIKAEKKNK